MVITLVPLGLRWWDMIRREDTPDRYARLCRCLLPDMPTTDAVVIKPTEAEISVRIRAVRRELELLGRECRDLELIAYDAGSTIDQMLRLQQSAPGISNLVFAAAQTALGVYTHENKLVSEGGQEALRELSGFVARHEEMTRGTRRLEVLREELVQIAPRFNGKIGAGDLVAVRYAEDARSLLDAVLANDPPRDGYLFVRNISGQDLTNCVIAMRLSNAEGQSTRRVYFTDVWPAGQIRGIRFETSGVFNDAIQRPTRVTAQFWAREISSSEVVEVKPSSGWPTPGSRAN